MPSIVAIGDDAANQREEENRQLAGKTVEAKVERGRQLFGCNEKPSREM